MRREDQEKARSLRRSGKTLQEIGDELNAGKGLVSLWVRDVEIDRSVAGVGRLPSKDELRTRAIIARAAWSEQRRRKREEFRAEGRRLATEGDVLHAVVCSLYWADGSKSRNAAQIVNSDPNILRLFLEFCYKYFDVPPQDVSLKVHGYTWVFSEQEMVAYWVKTLNLEEATHRAHAIDVFTYASRGGGSGRRKGKLPHGFCTITIKKSTRIVQHIYGAIEVYGNSVLDPS